MSNVTSLNGGSVAHRTPNETYIQELEAELERARSGETIGGLLICNYYDSTCDYVIAGHVCYYTTIGAATVALQALGEDARGC